MKFLSLPLLTLLALTTGQVLADSSAILSAIDEVTTRATDLNDTISNWDGGVFGAGPIVLKSMILLARINAATDAAKKSSSLSQGEATTVAVRHGGLNDDLTSCLHTVVDAKPKFVGVWMRPVMLLNLRQQKTAAGKLLGAVREKVPQEVMGGVQAKVLSGMADPPFDGALAAYLAP